MSVHPPTKNSVISPRSEVVAREIGDGQTVILDLNAGVYYRLNETGSMLWSVLSQGPRTIEQLAGIVAGEREIDADRCLKDVSVFVDDLVGSGLIHIEDGE